MTRTIELVAGRRGRRFMALAWIIGALAVASGVAELVTGWSWLAWVRWVLVIVGLPILALAIIWSTYRLALTELRLSLRHISPSTPACVRCELDWQAGVTATPKASQNDQA